MRRYYQVEEGDGDELFVIAEMPSWDDGRGEPYVYPEGWRGGMDNEYTREEVLAMPGGVEALDHWERRDDEAFETYHRREYVRALIREGEMEELQRCAGWF